MLLQNLCDELRTLLEQKPTEPTPGNYDAQAIAEYNGRLFGILGMVLNEPMTPEAASEYLIAEITKLKDSLQLLHAEIARQGRSLSYTNYTELVVKTTALLSLLHQGSLDKQATIDDHKKYIEHSTGKLLGAIGKLEQPVNLSKDPVDHAVEWLGNAATYKESNARLLLEMQAVKEDRNRYRITADERFKEIRTALIKTGADEGIDSIKEAVHCIKEWNVLRRAIAAIGASGSEHRPNPRTAADCLEIINDLHGEINGAREETARHKEAKRREQDLKERWCGAFVLTAFAFVCLVLGILLK